jgi:hypothetical protein
MVEQQGPARYKELVATAKANIQERFRIYEQLEKVLPPTPAEKEEVPR